MNYYDWYENLQTCSKCSWQGQGKLATTREMFDDGFESECPQCGEYFGFIMFPTVDEAIADPRAEPADRIIAEIMSERHLRHERTKLLSPDQLPDLDPAPTELTWDVSDTPTLKSEVIILAGEREIWREMSFYENYDRFAEIASILQAKYGLVLKDLVPTTRSCMDLYGDRLGSPAYVDKVREKLRSGIDPGEHP